MLYAIAVIAQEDGVAINEVIDRGHDDLAIRVALKVKQQQTPEQKHQAEQERLEEERMNKPVTFKDCKS